MSYNVAGADVVDRVKVPLAMDEMISKGTWNSFPVYHSCILRHPDWEVCLPGQRVSVKVLDDIVQISVLVANAPTRGESVERHFLAVDHNRCLDLSVLVHAGVLWPE